MEQIPRVLSIAGTDPSGGAGLQADLKSIQAMGGYGMAVVTVLVAQNTRGVRSLHVPPVSFLRQQLDAVSDDVAIDAVKIGMLHSAPIIAEVSDWLNQVKPQVVVLDPVMVATSGDRLLDLESEAALRELCSQVDLVTPNIPELAVLVGQDEAQDWLQACDQARELVAKTGATVLLKGGHLNESVARDAIVSSHGIQEFSAKRFATKNTHGTGCSLSSAMATLLASGMDPADALQRSKIWMEGAIRNADALHVGLGNGPIDHFWEHRNEAQTKGSSSDELDWCSAIWAENHQLRLASENTDFVRQLRSGELEQQVFLWYLGQDALYLKGYAEVMLRTAELAPNLEERTFWQERAQGAIVVESALHRARIGAAEPEASTVTLGYLNHLNSVAEGGNYAETVAAVLPCFWLYADIGERMLEHNHEAHEYRDWLSTYSDPEFARLTTLVIGLTNRVARESSSAVRQRMARAFRISLEHERDFFAAPTVLGR